MPTTPMWPSAVRPPTASGAERVPKQIAESARDVARASEQRHQANLLRCVFGSPFRAVPLALAQRTSVVVSLARAAYDERHLPSGELDSYRLAVLADALEEAAVPGELVEHLLLAWLACPRLLGSRSLSGPDLSTRPGFGWSGLDGWRVARDDSWRLFRLAEGFDV